jgi:hypothetical protein
VIRVEAIIAAPQAPWLARGAKRLGASDATVNLFARFAVQCLSGKALGQQAAQAIGQGQQVVQV